MACRTQSCPAADQGARVCGMAGTEWVHAAEYCREYDVQVQGVVRGTALGAQPGHSARRSDSEMRDPQSDDALGHAPDGARGMIEGLRKVDYL